MPYLADTNIVTRRVLPADAHHILDWRRLADTYRVVGRQVFDTRLVAVMLAHGITHLLTFNTGHFFRYAGLTVVDPATV